MASRGGQDDSTSKKESDERDERNLLGEVAAAAVTAITDEAAEMMTFVPGGRAVKEVVEYVYKKATEDKK